MSRFARDIRWGVGWGIGLAAVLSLFVVVMFVLRGGAPNRYGISTSAIIGFYGGIGLVGGAVLGLMRPLLQQTTGQVVVAFVLLFLVYGSGLLLFTPVMRERQYDAFLILLVIALIMAPVYAWMLRDPSQSGKRRDARRRS